MGSAALKLHTSFASVGAGIAGWYLTPGLVSVGHL
jgi:hypothetical protein